MLSIDLVALEAVLPPPFIVSLLIFKQPFF